MTLLQHALSIFLLGIITNCFAQTDPFPLRFWGSTLSTSGNIDQPVKAVGTGENLIVALKMDGTVVVWGQSIYGRCEVPKGLNDVIAISCSELHIVALKKDGSAVAWGGTNAHQNNIPSGLKGIKSVSASTGHTFAVMQDGTLQAWGDNNYGELDIPVGLSEVKAVASSGIHTLALKQNGTVLAWGNNNAGQCDVPIGLDHVVAIKVSNANSIALKDDGTVVVWGSDYYGALQVPANLSDVIEIAANNENVFAVKKDGKVVVWGEPTGVFIPGLNEMVQSLEGVVSLEAYQYHIVALKKDGTIVPFGTGSYVGTMTVPNNLTQIKTIEAGENFVVGLQQDGTPVAWGFNRNGQCNLPLGLKNIVALKAGGSHALALQGDGTVVAWGNNASNQCSVPQGLKDVVKIAAGKNHSVALKRDGTVVAWGDNSATQCDIPDRMSKVYEVVASQGGTGALANYEGFYISYDSAFVFWGNNGGSPSVYKDSIGIMKCEAGTRQYLLLNNAGKIKQMYYSLGNTLVTDTLKEVADISSGNGFNLALKRNGRVVIWEDEYNYMVDTVPHDLPKTKAIAAGSDFAVALLGEFQEVNSLSGFVYQDFDKNCQRNVLEKGIEGAVVLVQKSNKTYTTMTDYRGWYQMNGLDTGNYTVTVSRPIVSTEAAIVIGQTFCDTIFQVTFDQLFMQMDHLDVGYPATLCPLMEISLTSNRRRRCFRNQTTVQYCNKGNSISPSIEVLVAYPRFVELITASSPYALSTDFPPYFQPSEGERVFSFPIGLVEAGQCGSITLVDSVACGIEQIRGTTVCKKAILKQAEACANLSSSPKLEIHATCKDGSLTHVLRNWGNKDMEDSVGYLVLFNGEQAKLGQLKLQAHDSLLFTYSADKSYAFSLLTQTAASDGREIGYTTEGNVCKSDYWLEEGFDNAKGRMAQIPTYSQPWVASSCLPILDSYDPNDKAVFPAGVELLSSKGNILVSQELTYTIRFENTGSDTAYKVVIKDPLPATVDLRTLKMKAASHPFIWRVSGINEARLEVIFDSIYLPAKKQDSLHCSGFISFSIFPLPDLPLGTEIVNWAGIYFDYNSAIYTNVVRNVLWDGIFPSNDSLSSQVLITGSGSPLGIAPEKDSRSPLLLYPNPTEGNVTIRLEGTMNVSLYNSMGNKIIQCSGENEVSLEMEAQPVGLYLIEIQKEGRTYSKRVMKQ